MPAWLLAICRVRINLLTNGWQIHEWIDGWKYDWMIGSYL